MRITCYIVDDQKHSIEALTRLILRINGLELLGFDTDPLVALNKINTGVIKPDLIFVDIDMPELSGMAFSREVEKQAAVVFVTAHDQHALDAFGAGAVDYLLKPVDATLFLRAVERAKEKVAARRALDNKIENKEYVFVKLDSRNLKQVMLRDLMWIKADNKYMDLHIKNEKTITINTSMNNLESALPSVQFLRIHKSTIVNILHVESVVGNRLIMKSEEVLEIGKTYHDLVYARLNPL